MLLRSVPTELSVTFFPGVGNLLENMSFWIEPDGVLVFFDHHYAEGVDDVGLFCSNLNPLKGVCFQSSSIRQHHESWWW